MGIRCNRLVGGFIHFLKKGSLDEKVLRDAVEFESPYLERPEASVDLKLKHGFDGFVHKTDFATHIDKFRSVLGSARLPSRISHEGVC